MLNQLVFSQIGLAFRVLQLLLHKAGGRSVRNTRHLYSVCWLEYCGPIRRPTALRLRQGRKMNGGRDVDLSTQPSGDWHLR